MNANALVFIIGCFISAMAFAGIYKYKDSQDNWVYSDVKPKSSLVTEEVKYKTHKTLIIKPRVYTDYENGFNQLNVHNPYFAPIDIKVTSKAFQSGASRQTVPANATVTFYKSKNQIPKFRYRWARGAPNPDIKTTDYHFPVSSKRSHKITQSFNGKFSHSKRPSKHAVDIAMSVGTYISAARAGTVIWVKDDYHMGGKRTYFLDKANYVKVLHDDGSYAVYAHILLGTALVKPGDKVNVGDLLARSGSSGYSTGPHLHFVIRKNVGLKSVSLPFKFVDGAGKRFTPRRGMYVLGDQS